MPWSDDPRAPMYDLSGFRIMRRNPYLNLEGDGAPQIVMTGHIAECRLNTRGDTVAVDLTARFPDGREVRCDVTGISSVVAMDVFQPHSRVHWDGQSRVVQVEGDNRRYHLSVSSIDYRGPTPDNRVVIEAWSPDPPPPPRSKGRRIVVK